MSIDVDADFMVKLGLSLDGISAGISTMNKRAERENQLKLAAFPRSEALFSPPFVAAGFYDFGGPQLGRHWEVRLAGVVGIVTPANNAWVVGGTPPVVTFYEGLLMTGIAMAPGILPAGLVKWQFNALPAFDNFSGDQFIIHENQHLLVGVTTVPATTALTCIATINDFPISRGQVVIQGA
jgi:hypothetical protein